MLLLISIGAYANSTVTVTFYHYDGMGSPIAATDMNGNVVWQERREPFGATKLNQTAKQNHPVDYTGHVYDQELGLIYMGRRFYDPKIGRFISADPVGFTPSNVQSFNRYAYANNNPYKYWDPDGAFAQALVGAGIGAVTGAAVQGALMATGYQDSFSFAQLGMDTLLGAATGGYSSLAQAGKLGGIVKNGVGTFDSVASKSVSNPIPDSLARVIPGTKIPNTLGRPGTQNVFVTAIDDIQGLNAKQIAERLTIKPSQSFTIIEFPTPKSGIASPVFRNDAGFVGGGRTAGGAREFVIPNQSVPTGANIRFVEWWKELNLTNLNLSVNGI